MTEFQQMIALLKAIDARLARIEQGFAAPIMADPEIAPGNNLLQPGPVTFVASGGKGCAVQRVIPIRSGAPDGGAAG